MRRHLGSFSLLAITSGILAVWLAAPSAVFGQSGTTTYYWDTTTTGALWGTAADWNTDPSGAGGTTGVPVATSDVYFNGSADYGATIVQLGATGSTAKGLYFTNTGTTLLEGATTSETLTIGTDGIIVASTAGAVTLGCTTPANLMPISITGNQTWTDNSITNALNVISAISDTTASTLTIRGAGSTNISGIISNGTAALGLTMSGTGTLTLSALNTYTGTTTVGGGTLALTPAGATPVINSVANSSALVLQGGSLTMTGAASVNAFQQFSGTTINSGGSSISATDGASGGNFDVTLGAITRNAGGTVSFTLPTNAAALTTNGIATTTNNNASGAGILGGYATVGNDWAVSGATAGTISSVSGNNITFSAAQTAGNEVVFTSGTLPTGLSLNTPYYILTSSATSAVSATQGGTAITLTTTTSGAVVNSAGNISALSVYTGALPSTANASTTANYTLNSAQTQSGVVSANSLKITDTTPGDTLALGANTLTFNGTSGGLLYSGNSSYSITGSGLIGSGTGNEFIVTTTGSGNLTISAPLVSATTGSVTKAGAGTLTLTGANTFTGALTLDAGTLVATISTKALGAGTISLGGGALDLEIGSQLNSALNTTVTSNSQITSDQPTMGSAGTNYTFGTLAIGAQTLTIVGGANVSSGTAGVTFGAVTASNAATFTVNNPTNGGVTLLTLGAMAATALDTVTFNGSGNTTVTGVISGSTAPVTMAGTGTLTYNAGNTYSGATSVTNGTLVLANNSDNLSSTDITASPITVYNGATLAAHAGLGTISIGSIQTTSKLTLNPGSTFSMVDGQIGELTLATKGTPILTINGATLNFDVGVPGTDFLQAIASTDTVVVSGTNTINLVPFGSLLPVAGTYNLMQIRNTNASLAGTYLFSNASQTETLTVGGKNYTATLGYSVANLSEQVTIVQQGPTLTWTGQANGTGAQAENWDTGTSTNWANSSNSAVTYSDGSNVAFTDTNVVPGSGGFVTYSTIYIQSGGVTPAAVSFNASGTMYTIDATSGPIQGATTTLTIGGGTTQIINNENTYGGGTWIAGSPLIANPTAQFGSSTMLSGGVIMSGPFGTGTINLAGGALEDNGFTVVTLANNVTISANTQLYSAGTGTIILDGTNLTIPATVALSNNPILYIGSNTKIYDVVTGNGQNLTVTPFSSHGDLYLYGTNTYTGITTINDTSSDNGSGGVILSVAKLADGGMPSSIGTSSNAAANLIISDATLQYIGGGDSTNRLFTLTAGNTVNGGTLDASGTGAIVWTSTGAIVDSGNYPLTLTGSNTGANTLTPILTGTSTLTKSGLGTWVLAGSNTFTGGTSISSNGGILAVTGTGQLYAGTPTGSSIITVNTGGALEVDRWDIGGASPELYAAGAGSFGNLAGTNTLLVINGGTIMYSGNTNYHNTNIDGRGFTIGASGATLDAATAGQTWYINLNSSFLIADSSGGSLTLEGAGNGEIDKVIPASTGGLTMSGPGVWTLTAANLYTGSTSLNAGTLVMGNLTALSTSAVTLTALNNGLQFSAGLGSAKLGSLASTGNNGNIVLQDNAGSPAPVALTVGGNNSTNANYSGSLSGPGSLTMNSTTGTGVFTLSGASTYMGTTTVTKGTLLLANTASLGNTAISVSSGATLEPQAGSGTITAGNTGTPGAGATLNLTSGSTFSMVASNVGTFQLQQGSGFSSNALTLGGATLNFGLNGSVGSYQVPAVDLLAAGGPASVTGANTINLTLITSGVLNPGGPINLITASSFTGTGTFQFSNASTTENMTVGGVPYVLTLNNTPTAETLTIISNGPTLTWTGAAGSGSPGYTATWDVGMTSNWATSSNAPSTFATGDTVDFNDTYGVAMTPVTNSNIVIQSGGVSPTAVVFNNSIVNYTIEEASGPIVGAATLSKSGSGLLSILNSNNIYARGTTVTAGTLQISASTTVVSNAITQGPLGIGTLTLSGGTLDIGTSSTVMLANSVAVTANTTLSSSGGGPLVVDGTGLTPPATFVLSNNPTLTVNNTTTINDVISGSGQNLTVAGSGTLILDGVNTYSGTTTINSSATLQLGNGTTNGSVAGSITDNSALVFATTGSPSYATAISGSGTVTVNGTGSGTLTLSGGNSFQGGLTILGNGILTLSGANTYSGGTLIQSGTLRAGAVNTLPTTGSVTFGGPGSATGTLDLNGYGLTVGGLVVASGASTNAANQIITNSNTSGNGSTAMLTYNGTSPNSFAGTLKDGGVGKLLALTVASGNLALSGANTYTGATAVNGGSLQVVSSGSLDSAVTVNSSGVLSGSGAIGGLVTVNSGGVLAPSGVASAATPMTLNSGLTLANGAVLDFNLTTTPGSGDSVNVSGGSLSLGTTGGILNINEFGGGGELQATSYPLIYDSSITGNAAAWTVGDHVGDTGHTYSFTDTGGQFDLVVSIAGTSGTWKSNGLGSASYGDPGNWSSGTPGTIPNGVGVIATFGTGNTLNIKLDGTPNGPNFVAGGLVFNNPGFSYVLGSDGIGSLTLNNSGGGASVVATNAPYSTIGTTLTLADSSLTTTFNIDSASYLDVEGPINESTPTGQQIVLTGGGYLQLDGTNSYTGGTTVSDGILTVGLNGTGTLGSGPLAINAAGTTSIVNLSNNISVGGLSATVSGGGSAQLNVASGATLTVNQTGTGVFAGTLSLSAGGAGGGLTVGSGTVQLNVASASALGTGVTATVASGATLQLTGAVSALSDPNSGNLANVLTQGTGSASDGALQVTGATTQTVGVVSGQALSSSPTTYSGNTTVGDGTNAANLTATQILQNTLTINAGSTVTIAPSGSGISMDAVPATSAVATSDVATGAASSADDSTTDPFTAIEAAIASGSISSAKGQQLENRIAAIERLAATDPGLDVSLLEDRVLAALPSTSVWTSAASPLAEPGSSLLAVDSGNSASSFDAALSSAAAFAPAADFGGSPAAVPEPSSLLLATMAGIGILIAVRRRTTNCES